MKQVLLFNLAGEKRERILFLASALGLSCREVRQAEQGLSVAELCGRGPLPPLVRREPASFTEEMLVLDGLEPPQFHALLDGMRGLQATVALKAVVTEQNLGWSAAALHGALREDHAQLRPRGEG